MLRLEREEREVIMKLQPLQKQDPDRRIAPIAARTYFGRQILCQNRFSALRIELIARSSV